MHHLVLNRSRGAALIIVLAFLVLLSALVVAYLARTVTDRQLAQGNYNSVKANELARSGLSLIVADLKQEIAAGGTPNSSNVGPQRSPKPSFVIVPAITNLIRRSVRSDAIPLPAVASLASTVNSTADPSLNGRSISLARWNTSYMIPRVATTGFDSDPITTGFSGPNYWAPDWVVVTRAGPVAFTSWDSRLADSAPANQSFGVGRYAFVIYDEGGMLDANVVGLPSPTPSPAELGGKGTPALVDLTAIKYTPLGATASNAAISKIPAWRNYATLQSTGTFPGLIPDTARFMPYALLATQDFKTVAPTVYLQRTDQAFASRQELIGYFHSSGSTFNLLQFLGTFSREANTPTYKPSGSTAALTARFDISHLSLVQDAPATAQKADIKKYFGLQWVDGTPGQITPLTPAVPGHWQYVGGTGTTPLSSIPSFTADPEFFQMLNYGLFGTNASDSTDIGTTLSVGACIIDQYDDTSADPLTGTTTTMIEYNGGWAVGEETVDPARSPTPPPAGMSPTPRPTVAPYPMLNRPFRNVGEFGYALKPPGPQTIDFETSGSADGPILDLFTYNTAPIRAGIVNLNTANLGSLAALLKGATTVESAATLITLTPANNAAANPTPNPTSGIIGHPTLGTLVNPAVGRQDIPRLTAAAGTALGNSGEDEKKESAARALADLTQTRTWNLFIDIVGQSGRYSPSASALKDFLVEGEKRYWLHIAIDRFTGTVIDEQLEAVEE